jgi:hypothetical protein
MVALKTLRAGLLSPRGIELAGVPLQSGRIRPAFCGKGTSKSRLPDGYDFSLCPDPHAAKLPTENTWDPLLNSAAST